MTRLELGDSPDRWEALGFAVSGGVLELGGVRVVLGCPGDGITRWAINGIADTEAIDGLPTSSAPHPPQPSPVTHPNGAVGLDHVVITTPDFDRTAKALEDHAMPLRRVRDAGGFRQGFRRLGPAILELVEAKGEPTADPARFWGLVVIVRDLGWLASQLEEQGRGWLGDAKRAVQPGRQIATLKKEAGLGQPVAFMTPEPAPAEAVPRTTPCGRSPDPEH